MDEFKKAEIIEDYQENAKEQNLIAKSAKNKGKNSKAFNTTHKSMEAKDGVFSTMEINLNSPMNYKTFKLLSNDLMEMYYNYLVEKYGVGMEPIAKMMGVSSSNTLYQLFTKRGIKYKRGKRGTYNNREEWEKFMRGEFATNNADPKPDTSSIKEAEDAINKKLRIATLNSLYGLTAEKYDNQLSDGFTHEATRMTAEYHMTFAKVNNIDDILKVLSKLPLPEDATVKIHILPNVFKAFMEENKHD